MITLKLPNNYQAEQRYIVSVLLGEFLGLDFKIHFTDCDNVSLTSGDHRELIVAVDFFALPACRWMTPESLPRQPLKLWDLKCLGFDVNTVTNKIPVIYGLDPDSPNFFTVKENRITIGLDIFGLSFFMLTRYEEVVKKERDNHDRFPAKASLSYQEDFLFRPIVNECLEILWDCMKRLWPGLKRKDRRFKIVPTHDVDKPYAYFDLKPARVAISFAGELIRRRSPVKATRELLHCLHVKTKGMERDPYNTFDSILDINEKYGLTSTFYFITDHSGGAKDGYYSINHRSIRHLMRHIHERGHDIGLHASYNTCTDFRQMFKEFKILKSVCKEEGIRQELWGSRQHNLRWETPITFANLEKAGLDYDTTLGYADHAGFRCGTCYEYPVYDLKAKKQLNLKERPLIVMDGSIIENRYMNLGTGRDAQSALNTLKNRCRLFNGDFILLWHNNRFVNNEEVWLYESLLRND